MLIILISSVSLSLCRSVALSLCLSVSLSISLSSQCVTLFHYLYIYLSLPIDSSLLFFLHTSVSPNIFLFLYLQYWTNFSFFQELYNDFNRKLLRRGTLPSKTLTIFFKDLLHYILHIFMFSTNILIVFL